jgi:hypothetical protein
MFKPDYAAKFFPEWWKDLPRMKTIIEHGPNNTERTATAPTIKNCPGVMDYYKNGFIIPLWCDHLFEVGKINTDYLRVVPVDQKYSNTKHPVDQRGNYLPENKFTHIKLESPWFLKTNKKVNFMWIKPSWNFDNPNDFIQPPSVIEFYHQHATNVNIFFERKAETYKLLLNAGIPVGHFIPISDDRIEIKHHLLSDLEFTQLKIQNNIRFSFDRSYIKYVKFKNSQGD